MPSDRLAWRAYCRGTIKTGQASYENKIRKAVQRAFKQFPTD